MTTHNQSALEVRMGLAPAPGELQLVQAFVDTIDLKRDRDELDSPRALADWLASRGLLAAGTDLDGADLERVRCSRPRRRRLARPARRSSRPWRRPFCG